MHDLARNLDEVNTTVKGDSKIESLVTGVENGQRSFKVFIAPPQGVSYAKDIAEKYGVTFDKIKNRLTAACRCTRFGKIVCNNKNIFCPSVVL